MIKHITVVIQNLVFKKFSVKGVPHFYNPPANPRYKILYVRLIMRDYKMHILIFSNYFLGSKVSLVSNCQIIYLAGYSLLPFFVQK